MNRHIDQVIADNMVLSNIPVEAKGQAGDRPVEFLEFGSLGIGEQALQDIVVAQSRDLKPVVVGNIGIVIHLPRGAEGIAVNQPYQDKQQTGGEPFAIVRCIFLFHTYLFIPSGKIGALRHVGTELLFEKLKNELLYPTLLVPFLRPEYLEPTPLHHFVGHFTNFSINRMTDQFLRGRP